MTERVEVGSDGKEGTGNPRYGEVSVDAPREDSPGTGTVVGEQGRVSPDVDGERGEEGPNIPSSEPDLETDSTTVSPSETTYTPRFTGFILLFAALTAIGILTFHPAAIAAGGVLLAFLIAGIMQTPPSPRQHLTTSYSVTPEHPRPAESVTVEVTVSNPSDRTFTDIRLIDAVPEALRVTDGSPREAQALRPGEEVTLNYTVAARRGSFTFGPVTARTRTLMGSMWTQEQLPIETEGRIRCAVRADDIPLEERATHYIGGLLGDSGGDGVEFYATREYHRGDSPRKINWREYAKRGELSSITYREQQAAEVTLICDARLWSRVTGGPGTPSAAILGMYAAYQITTTLTTHGHYVGLTIPGIQPSNIERQNSHFPYRRFDHDRGSDLKQRVFNLLTEVESTITDRAYAPGETVPLRDFGTGSFCQGGDSNGIFDLDPYQIRIGEFATDLTKWASPTTQFIFITPLLDDGAHGLCEQLHSMGYPVVVISPDVTKLTSVTSHSTTPSMDTDDGNETETHGIGREAQLPNRILRIQRATRIESLRHNDFTVIDWDPQEPLSVCCDRQTLPGRR